MFILKLNTAMNPIRGLIFDTFLFSWNMQGFDKRVATLRTSQHLAGADHVALDVVQLLEAGNGNAVFLGDFAQAVTAADLVVAVLG